MSAVGWFFTIWAAGGAIFGMAICFNAGRENDASEGVFITAVIGAVLWPLFATVGLLMLPFCGLWHLGRLASRSASPSPDATSGEG